MSNVDCPACGLSQDQSLIFDIRLGEVVVIECTECGYQRADDPDVKHSDILVERLDFVECSSCGGPVVVRVWGEGIDAEVWCEKCDKKEIYR